tara:strand:+ start:8583 stop:8738 length:156 start_codon:yes stop_codon:yes gene_type:complete
MNCDCEKNKKVCDCKVTAEHIGFDAWLEVLEEEEQPTCNIENQEDCENCGS